MIPVWGRNGSLPIPTAWGRGTSLQAMRAERLSRFIWRGLRSRQARVPVVVGHQRVWLDGRHAPARLAHGDTVTLCATRREISTKSRERVLHLRL